MEEAGNQKTIRSCDNCYYFSVCNYRVCYEQSFWQYGSQFLRTGWEPMLRNMFGECCNFYFYVGNIASISNKQDCAAGK
jgi:hypothetical protein